MERQSVSSSNLRSVGYDENNQVLEIEFQSGSVYEYFDVPQAVYAGLMNAPSKGAYLNDNIRPTYRFRKIR
jgi:hypothetical protein